jgi:ferric-dicitrate binding protein FerR (iron transport regulator)
MKLCHWFLRIVSPRVERERRDFRKEIARSEAHAENFCRTVTLSADQLATICTKKPQVP